MRVLVMESDPGAAEDAAAALQAAGHEVARCHDRDAPSFPCAALIEDRGCPLEGGVVDVGLVVRGHPWPRPTAREHGITCAVRAGVPVVVAGRVALNPFEPWAGGVSDDPERTVADCLAVASAPLADASAIATRMLQSVLGPVDAGGADAVVRRRDGRLRVALRIPAPIERGRAEMAATRVMGALSVRYPEAGGIDVLLEDTTGGTTALRSSA